MPQFPQNLAMPMRDRKAPTRVVKFSPSTRRASGENCTLQRDLASATIISIFEWKYDEGCSEGVGPVILEGGGGAVGGNLFFNYAGNSGSESFVVGDELSPPSGGALELDR